MPRQCRTPGRRRPARSGHGAGVRLLALAGGVAMAVLAAAPAAASGSRPARPGDPGQPGKARAVVPPMSVPVTAVDAARTFLPYWPGKSASRNVKPLSLAWVWPLVDVPHQAACPSLINDSLAASLASGGRLNDLLSVGSSSLARSADLTWAIDPALLNDANVMTD